MVKFLHILQNKLYTRVYFQKSKFQNRHEAARRPSTRRLQHVFEKKANRMLLIASQTLEHSTGLTLGTRRASHLGKRSV